ncbi:MAG: 4-(cytidine 5'-diphospho)-2-C-methyl-D-erythritol kinase [Alphaproteobacteria bacterium]|nr:4-(cytidine 5'-diphospho)-2-C-methyl-D-erythritol kinase [Alphaproteobacteria bacterium]
MNALHDVLAPAKLNLFLHITGRRADGYHQLQSAFMLIDWCDVLHFDLTEDGRITRQDLTVALPADDLIVRAARLLQQASGTRLGAHMAVEKHLPAMAGLGGGSSDAATTLLALNRLWGLGWSRRQLSELGLKLGADVPFFLFGGHAWAEGVGETLTPLDLPRQRWLIVKPPAGLSTPAIFSDPDLERAHKSVTISDFVAQPFSFGQNDLQQVAQRLCPDVLSALMWLESLGLKPRMTGSGSAVFAPVDESMVLPPAPAGHVVQLCHNLDRHPLAGWCSSDE